jgi:phage antirepressor YoqD-like protein
MARERILVDLIATNAAARRTMTSRELAEIAGKRHDNVMQVCRDMRASGVCPEIQETPYTHPQNGQTYIESVLNERDSYVVMARLSPEFTGRLVDRWQQLERATAPAIPQTYAAALRLAAEQAEQLERQQQALDIAEPKAAALDRLAGADGTMCVTNAAKTLKVPPRKLFAWLSAERWIYKRAGSAAWTAYQDRIQSGHLQHKTTTVARDDGSEKVVDQVLVTAKGLAKLAKVFGAEGGAA